MKLKKTSAALIINQDLSTEIRLPSQKDEDYVLDNSLYIVLIGTMLVKEDAEFMDLIIRKKSEYLPEVKP